MLSLGRAEGATSVLATDTDSVLATGNLLLNIGGDDDDDGDFSKVPGGNEEEGKDERFPNSSKPWSRGEGGLVSWHRVKLFSDGSLGWLLDCCV